MLDEPGACLGGSVGVARRARRPPDSYLRSAMVVRLEPPACDWGAWPGGGNRMIVKAAGHRSWPNEGGASCKGRDGLRPQGARPVGEVRACRPDLARDLPRHDGERPISTCLLMMTFGYRANNHHFAIQIAAWWKAREKGIPVCFQA
jgi:hypothetical protein